MFGYLRLEIVTKVSIQTTIENYKHACRIYETVSNVHHALFQRDIHSHTTKVVENVRKSVLYSDRNMISKVHVRSTFPSGLQAVFVTTETAISSGELPD